MSQENFSQNSIELHVETIEMIDKTAELILDCDAILFTSGAGMGVSIVVWEHFEELQLVFGHHY